MAKKSKKFLNGLTKWLVLTGALSWGLIGAFDFNLVTSIFGIGTLTSIVYLLVGLSAIYQGYLALK